MMLESSLPLLAVLIPLLSVSVVPFLKAPTGNRFTAFTTLVTFLIVASMYPSITAGNILQMRVETGFEIPFSFFADSFSLLVGLSSSVLWMLSTVYSVEYMKEKHAQKRYNIFSLLSLSGMMGTVFTGNLFTLFLFFELLTVASYVMVIHDETEEARKGGLIYLIMGIGGGLILLASIIATYTIVGTGDFLELPRLSERLIEHPAFSLILIGFVLGFGTKAGLFPLHVWLPIAHPIAPAPGSALLSAVMIKAGAYGIIRVVLNVVGIEGLKGEPVFFLTLILALISIFLGSALAIRQTEIKRMLAYSSVSQIGYIVLGASLFSPSGLIGGMIHIFNHAIIKGSLFLCAGAFIHQTGLRQIRDLKGIGRRMPITTLSFSVAALSLIGFPPFNGFVSKWYLAVGALEASKVGAYGLRVGMVSLGILLLSSFMNLVYYGPIVYGAWFSGNGPSREGARTREDPNGWMMVALILLGAGTLIFGLFPQLPVGLAEQALNQLGRIQ